MQWCSGKLSGQAMMKTRTRGWVQSSPGNQIRDYVARASTREEAAIVNSDVMTVGMHRSSDSTQPRPPAVPHAHDSKPRSASDLGRKRSWKGISEELERELLYTIGVWLSVARLIDKYKLGKPPLGSRGASSEPGTHSGFDS